jgi:hypothetical protein
MAAITGSAVNSRHTGIKRMRMRINLLSRVADLAAFGVQTISERR